MSVPPLCVIFFWMRSLECACAGIFTNPAPWIVSAEPCWSIPARSPMGGYAELRLAGDDLTVTLHVLGE